MNTAKIMPEFNLKRAVLSCLAWALLLVAAPAGELSRPLCDAAAPDEFSDAPDCVLSTQAGDYSPTECVTVASSESETEQSGGWPRPTNFTAPGCSKDEAPPNSLWKYVPMGMIPYVGPRTPDDMKDLGICQPLGPRGWRSNPFSITTFVGVTDGSPLISGQVHQRASVYAGLNFGWDYDHYWGIEKRLGFGALNLTNEYRQPIAKTGLSVTGEYRLMYYPLGDTRWRPFLTAGGGWSDFYYYDNHGESHLATVGMVPIGLGLKYFHTERLAARIDFIDEVTFGNGPLSNFEYFAFTAGLEFRYGKKLLRMPWSHKGGS